MDVILTILLLLVAFVCLNRRNDIHQVVSRGFLVKSQRPRGSYPRRHRRGGYNSDHHDLPLVIGGQTDRHGCLRSAGYSWDTVEQKCTRPWISHLN